MILGDFLQYFSLNSTLNDEKSSIFNVFFTIFGVRGVLSQEISSKFDSFRRLFVIF
jgi:hypothetical protein